MSTSNEIILHPPFVAEAPESGARRPSSAAKTAQLTKELTFSGILFAFANNINFNHFATGAAIVASIVQPLVDSGALTIFFNVALYKAAAQNEYVLEAS
jgi:hypothetical protein